MTMHPKKRYSHRHESGVVLVIALIMLVLITLFAISAIRLSTIELQISGNEQYRRELAAAAQEGIERHINNMTVFNNIIAGVAVGTVSYPVQGGRYNVSVLQPVCKQAVPLPGNSLVNAGVSSSETSYWELVATVEDTVTGAKMSTVQGIRMRLPLSSCPV